MESGRLEAFSDGVIAIIITIMVLEFKTPHGSSLQDLLPVLPTFFSYVLSFVYIAIYWNNHHHLFQTVDRVSGATLWANLHLLFWLSLFPFLTAWAGENDFARVPVAFYGADLLMAGVAYYILVRVLIACQGPDSSTPPRGGYRLEGPRVGRALRRRDFSRVLVAVRFVRDLCLGRRPVVHPRQANRERAQVLITFLYRLDPQYQKAVINTSTFWRFQMRLNSADL